MSLLKGFWILG